ncbi:hypothetical protein [Brevibacillus migulae]|nr:hypothetical protein [Brevibacillus migulae]
MRGPHVIRSYSLLIGLTITATAFAAEPALTRSSRSQSIYVRK